MPLYFKYRTPFDTLTSKFTKKIEADSILKWFQEIWKADLKNEKLYQYYQEKFGTHFYGLGHFAWNISEKKPKPSLSIRTLKKRLKDNAYINEIKLNDDKYLEVLTDDDETKLAWYIIEEEYAKSDLKRFSYLLHENWSLPLDFDEKPNKPIDFKFRVTINPKEKRNGELYFLSVYNNSGDGPIDNYPTKFEGIRLTDLSEYLVKEKFHFEDLEPVLFFYMIKLREQKNLGGKSFFQRIKEFDRSLPELHKLFHYNIDLDTDKLCSGFEEAKREFDKAFAALSEREKTPAWPEYREFKNIRDVRMNGNEHFIQISVQGDYWKRHPVDSDLRNSKIYDQIFLFDDFWVNTNYDLAHSLLDYYTNWKL